MEVSCKIVDPFYCIWLEKGQFHIEDVDFQKIISLSKTQLEWFTNSIAVLVKEPAWKFFSKSGNDDAGITRLSKFQTPSGWFLSYEGRHWNFLNENAPSISRNPFEAPRKLGGKDEDLDRPESEPVLKSLSEKPCFRWNNSNQHADGLFTHLEDEKAAPEERENQYLKIEKTVGLPFNAATNGLSSSPHSNSLQLNIAADSHVVEELNVSPAVQPQFFNFDEPKSDSCSKKAVASTFNDSNFVIPVVKEAFCELSTEGNKEKKAHFNNSLSNNEFCPTGQVSSDFGFSNRFKNTKGSKASHVPKILKHYIRKQTSFNNVWTALLKSEFNGVSECCIWSVNVDSSSKCLNFPSTISNSKVSFLRGSPCKDDFSLKNQLEFSSPISVGSEDSVDSSNEVDLKLDCEIEKTDLNALFNDEETPSNKIPMDLPKDLFIKHCSPDVVMIQESKKDTLNSVFIKSLLSFMDIGWDFVAPVGSYEGILTMWDSSKIWITEVIKRRFSLSIKCLTLCEKVRILISLIGLMKDFQLAGAVEECHCSMSLSIQLLSWKFHCKMEVGSSNFRGWAGFILHEQLRSVKMAVKAWNFAVQAKGTDLYLLMAIGLVFPQNVALVTQFSIEEIFKAWKALGSSKAPGSDGFTAEFLIKHWSNFKDIFKSLMAVFHRNGRLNAFAKVLPECLKQVKDAIISPTQSAFIEASRGIRQGDPLSPFLFLLVSEVLGEIINKLHSNGQFEGFLVGKDMIHLPLLQFANDTLLFCKYDVQMLLQLKDAIRLFEWCSGQKVNREKSALSGVNVGEDDLIQTANLLDCKAEKLPIIYLGLPLGGYPQHKMFGNQSSIEFTRN
ncbi:Transposon TX1 uncharacterized [Cucumis melo var. makuwa]|uniref:Transposon TX1 uncharacterized n=1 Tax=Cucumis melo var. makuwa TaxID=1194695 RepID=A0A5D3BTI0_CUCMM|nr:Transposon TX1 uncharacterized [Cucumis melo var. makuwa]